MLKNYFLTSFFIVFVFTGCFSKHEIQVIDLRNIDNIEIKSASLQHTIEEKVIKQDTLDKKLYSFYNEWQGVKYKFGGNSKSGIDCSALIQKAFKDKLDLVVPRTTLLQSKLGFEIDKSQLNTGDLVFFKTGKNSRHVGIYLEDGKFIHASTKRGVSISSLDNVYFKRHYWKSQRIID